MTEYESKRYKVMAKRENTSEAWSTWTDVDTIEEAQMHAKHIEELGFLSKIIDREDKTMDRNEYCKDCDRSIYATGDLARSCDNNIADNGYYNLAGEKCYCKIVNGKRAEKYPWEGADNEQRAD